MRITLVTESFGTTVKAVVDRLVDTGHEVQLVTPAPGPSSYRGCRVVRISADGLGARVRDAIREHGPDLVHVTSPARLGRKALKHARNDGFPTLVTQQAPVEGFGTDYWRTKVAERADALLVTATWMRERLSVLDVPAQLWSPGVDTRAFAPHLRDPWLHEVWSRRHGPGGPRVVVGFVGDLEKRHGVRALVEVARVPGTSLVVVGDGSQRSWLRDRLPGARFTGDLASGDLSRAMASLDLLVHPGTRLTCAHSLREGAASGVPVVAPRAGGALEVVRPLETGLLYDPDDPHALRRTVAAVVGDRHRHLLGARGRELARLRDWPTAVDELVELHYRPLLRTPGSPYAA